MAHIQADAPSPISTRVQNTDDKKKGLLVEDDNVVDDLYAVFFQPRHVVLCLNLLDAKGLAEPRVDPTGFYCVVLGVSPLGDEMPTPLVVGQPDPEWNMLCFLPLKDHPWDGDSILRVEVIRVDQGGYRADPGTSNGFAVVGRAEIPLPSRVRELKTGPFELFCLEGAEGKVRGNVNLEMQLLPFEDFEVNF